MSRAHAALRDADWLTQDRANAFARVLLVLLIGSIAISSWAAQTMNVGPDFAAFWTSAKLALDGRAGDAYGEPARAALVALLGPGNHPPFFYPPTALLLWLPFALMPFATAAVLWVTATGAAYATAIRAILKGGSIVPAIAFPAVLTVSPVHSSRKFRCHKSPPRRDRPVMVNLSSRGPMGSADFVAGDRAGAAWG